MQTRIDKITITYIMQYKRNVLWFSCISRKDIDDVCEKIAEINQDNGCKGGGVTELFISHNDNMWYNNMCCRLYTQRISFYVCEQLVIIIKDPSDKHFHTQLRDTKIFPSYIKNFEKLLHNYCL